MSIEKHFFPEGFENNPDIPNILVNLDPSGHWTPIILGKPEPQNNSDFNQTAQTIMHYCGLIPQFLSNHMNDDLNAFDTFSIEYEFGMFALSKAIIEDGLLKYPGDPDMHPLVEILYKHNEKIYIYENSIVAIVQLNGKAFITRMD